MNMSEVVSKCIYQDGFPSSANQLFGDFLNCQEGRFNIQEGSLIDFKENVPDKFANGYGAGIVRLALAFHNTYGGLIVFGVSESVPDHVEA